MAGTFRRAALRGSDELFRPTRSDLDHDPGVPPGSDSRRPSTAAVEPVTTGSATRPEGRLIRLTDEELHILADAVQRLKFPGGARPATKPPVDVFERLEELRQKLIGAR